MRNNDDHHHSSGPPGQNGRWSRLLLMGPAFVAAIAYVDPGNVAANLTAGANYGYLLVWVLVAANAMAVLVQYQSAKLGLATGLSLPEILGKRLGTRRRRLYWVQAEVVAGATDMAEVIGGAVALNLLFGLPLLAGGLIIGMASMLLLALQSARGQRSFEYAILVLLGVIAVGFMSGLFVNPPDAGSALAAWSPGSKGRTRFCWRPACSAQPLCHTPSTCTRRWPGTGTASPRIPPSGPGSSGPRVSTLPAPSCWRES